MMYAVENGSEFLNTGNDILKMSTPSVYRKLHASDWLLNEREEN